MHLDFINYFSVVNYGLNNKLSNEFFSYFDREVRPRMIACLQSRGASSALAEDIVSEILTDCLADTRHNLLARFKGVNSVDIWLLRVGINRLISHQRRECRVQDIGMEEIPFRPSEDPQVIEEELQRIVSKALQEALESLPEQWRLLLWLRHGYKIPQKRLCICWRSTPSKLSRSLSSARDAVRNHTLRSMQKVDSGLNLEWKEIFRACADAGLF